MKIFLPAGLLIVLAGCAGHVDKKSWEGANEKSPINLAMGKITSARPKVAVAVLGAAEFMGNADSSSLGKFRASMAAEVGGSFERDLLKNWGDRNNFVLVDRMTLSKIMDELTLSVHPEFSDDMRVEVGRLAGATHLVFFHFIRHPLGQNRFEDNLTSRLIDIETGQVLAVQNLIRTYR